MASTTPSRPTHDPAEVTIRYLRPPDDVEIFVQRLVYEDPSVKVTFAPGMELETPLRIEGGIALERGSDVVWFTFPDAWHDIGRFHRSDGTLTGIYANVILPCEFEPGNLWRTTDLFLDLWISASDGRWEGGPSTTAMILDEAQLEAAEARGWVDPATAERARAEAVRLLGAARAGDWPPPVVLEWTRDRVRGHLEER